MKNYIFVVVIIIIGFFLTIPASAQEKMAITITPPLIKNNVNPGQIWKSYIKVVNNNAQDIDIYIELINFESGDETGTVKLVPKDKQEIEANKYLINNWINIERGPITIPAFQSKDVSFIVDVPEAIDPGDHHLAILVGTEPNQDSEEGSSIKVSSKIGSLLLLNVNGEIKENGIVREFTTDNNFYSIDDVNFTLRFQNTGNTILQPRGEIRIYDWQEKDQGVITINHKTNSGNIFPQDIRRWEYSFEVPTSILQMGRYKAEMILTYGKQTQETVERVVYFWVIQTKPVLISLALIATTILFIVLLVRRYIKKAVMRTQKQIGAIKPQKLKAKTIVRAKKIKTIDDRRDVVDLKELVNKKVKRNNDS